MRTKGRTMVWLGAFAAGFLAAQPVRGESGVGSGQGFYFRGGIGPEIAHRTDVTDLFGPLSGTEVKYDPGFRISAAAGFNFCRYFSAEFETGILYNSIKSINGPGSSGSSTDASLANVPLLINAVFHFPLESRFVPYCGAGIGGSSSVLTIDHATINSNRLDGDDSDVVWAAQAFAGFRYEFNERMGVGFGYKFLATGEPSWDVFSFTSAATSGELRFDRARTHSFVAEFTLKF